MSEIEAGSRDLEVAQFLESLPRSLTFEEYADRVLFLFGRADAWSLDRIRGYFGKGSSSAKVSGGRGRKGYRYGNNPDIVDAIRQHERTSTLDELLTRLAKQFPGRKLPSRSALHRFLQRDQDRR